jgi:hypothetical protein
MVANWSFLFPVIQHVYYPGNGGDYSLNPQNWEACTEGVSHLSLRVTIRGAYFSRSSEESIRRLESHHIAYDLMESTEKKLID